MKQGPGLMQPSVGLSWQACVSEPYSPGTPVQSPGVKQEFEWPSVEWDDTVIDLDLQHDLLVDWYSGSEEESSGCSDSSEDEYEWDDSGEPPARSEASSSLHAQWFINVKNQSDP